VSQVVLVPPHNWAVCPIIIPTSMASLKGLLPFSVEATTRALLQCRQVWEVSIQDLHTHGVLVDGHLDGLFKPFII
jgi:hypothetical protein